MQCNDLLSGDYMRAVYPQACNGLAEEVSAYVSSEEIHRCPNVGNKIGVNAGSFVRINPLWSVYFPQMEGEGLGEEDDRTCRASYRKDPDRCADPFAARAGQVS
jgi:hypothetical protein